MIAMDLYIDFVIVQVNFNCDLSICWFYNFAGRCDRREGSIDCFLCVGNCDGSIDFW